MTPDERKRATDIYYIAKHETESSVGIERIAAQIREAEWEAMQLLNEISRGSFRDGEQAGFHQGFKAAREQAAKIILEYRNLHPKDTLIDKDGFLIGLEMVVRQMEPK